MTRAKYGLSMAGMALAVVGVATGNRYVVWAAMIVLGLAVVARIVMRRGHGADESEPAD
ncbi:MAG TPA: hypothetical protein VK845_11745 [Gemmatimonadales bacterium]|nr:hypothetical protein [Gemmatimonadales bacterium]